MNKRIAEIFTALGCQPSSQARGLPVHCPADGNIIAHLPQDTSATLESKIQQAQGAQRIFCRLKREARAALLEHYAAALREKRELLAEIITLDGGKTPKEALGEVNGSADILIKTIKDATLPEFNGMLRCKERPPVGVIGLITSFNFPMVVAHWTIAPAWLAGNAVLWKPSEKTPLVALACKAIFDKAAGAEADLLHVLIGGRDIGQQLVAHERVDMISATGSVAMGQSIKKALASKKNNRVRPILELGGNNGVIISDKMSFEHLEWSVKALLNSFFGTTGQRCTNTRRLFVQRHRYEKTVELLEGHIRALTKDKWDEYGYGPLIDADAYRLFEQGKKRAAEEGGEIRFGKRLFEKERPQTFFVEPALALIPVHTAVMGDEVFAPLLFVAPYDDLNQAIAFVNTPANAGLVNGIYTQSQAEADRFAAENEAGHSVINSAKGTGTSAFGMGFGGNKASGTGEILNAADPLRPFTRDEHYHRIAQNKDIAMDR
ncbi:MAG: aldehyde dehydrogenase family protein [Pseudomonadota bacterium]|nr:aldehyde dehydrogenase family protein [Pseudomonadota bacterium]